ncbi:MAG: ribosome biogenesis GTPase Der [Pseudomonadota bacterium]
MGFTVAIIGRPNVGKSTLFNRLVGKRLALVDDTPGVTRDRRAGEASLGRMQFTVIDTAGLEEAFDDSLEARMRRQTEQALGEADIALLLIDARVGVTPLDRHFAQWLRRASVPVFLLANKCEGRASEPGLLEAFELGLGEPIAISAEHGLGTADLAEKIMPLYDAKRAETEKQAEPEGDDGSNDESDDDRVIQLAIVGRPNVGKSTLINALIGEDRVLTGPEAGITRDAIAVDWRWRDRSIRLVDTAGMRRRSKVTDKVERLSVSDGLNSVKHAQIVLLVLDADAILDKQDLTIARRTLDEGRALLIAINKWDAVSDRSASLARLRDRLETSLPQARGIPTVTISALKRRNLDRMMDAVLALYEVWNRRVPTGPLNRWFQGMVEAHPPPTVSGRRLKLRYITQVKARPPTFALWTTRAAQVPDSYVRYLINGLRQSFDLEGVPIRLQLRQGRNPYADKS